MRQIEASEVKPGMEVRWEQGGITYECTISSVGPASFGVNVMAQQSAATIYDETPVMVLSEPALPQPEEPAEFGARVVVNERRFLRSPVVRGDSQPWLEENGGIWRDWDDLCEMGLVQVVPDRGWTVPDDAPEVPERIEKWPEDDTAMRKYKWVDRDADTWIWIEAQAKWECRNQRGECQMVRGRPSSWFAPFIRVTDA